MKVTKGLGKGLSALFNETSEDYSRFTYDESKMTEEQANAVYEIELEKIFANPNQPRKVFDEEASKLFNETMEVIWDAYRRLESMGILPEDARYLLPNGCTTNITITTIHSTIFRIFYRIFAGVSAWPRRCRRCMPSSRRRRARCMA